MAHSTLHFSVGMIAGTVAAFPPLARAWLRGRRLARHFLRWFALSYVLGFIAVFPGILRRLGLPDAAVDSPWMNAFLLYPLINAAKPGAHTMGPLLLGACFALQYLLLLGALLYNLRRRN